MIKKLAVRFALVIAASCSIGLGVNMTTYSADGDMGVYVAGFGLERGSQAVLPSLWLCGEDKLPSWRCPAEEAPAIRARRVVPVLPDWQTLSIDHMIWLAMNVDADRDWSRCQVYWSVTMNVACDDGFEVKV